MLSKLLLVSLFIHLLTGNSDRFFIVRLCRFLTFTKESDPVSLVSAGGVFVSPAHVVKFYRRS